MKELIAKELCKLSGLKTDEVLNLIEIPPSSEMGDYAFPCFSLAKQLKKNPIQIALELSVKIKSKEFEKVEAKGPYLNFFLNRNNMAEKTLNEILKQKEKFGSSKEGKGKKIVIDLSAPNIAKPFGIGHLRSTIIGNSIANISSFLGYKPIKINYLGDWGTQFGKLILGYKKFRDEKKFNLDPIAHLQELYVKVNQHEELEDEARLEFKKLEDGDKTNLELWKKFREISLIEFDKIYDLLGIKFDVISGESLYNTKMEAVVKELKRKSLLTESEGAQIVDLNKFNLGVCLIEKKDGATLYATRDITAALDRYKKYKFHKMFYEVGSEQSLHFKQFFKVLELMGNSWAKDCAHIAHGLYLDSDGKKFATRKGKTVYMADILNETIQLAKEEISKREKISEKELNERALKIALAAILYGDLRNFRENNIIFDIERFLSFEGNTGPYLLYTYARSQSILRKANYKKAKLEIKSLGDKEKSLILDLGKFPEVVMHTFEQLAPNLIANYSYDISQKFNEFYHSEKVIGSEHEQFRLALVDTFSIVLKNALNLLGIKVIEKM
jgi:arginyl-tRNA synthetase